MEATYNNHIGIYHNSVDPSWCDALIDHFEKNNFSSIDRNLDDNFSPQHVKDKALFLKDPTLTEYFIKTIQKSIYPHYFNQYPYLPIEAWEIKSFKIQKTLPTEGFHQWHGEWSPKKQNINRFLVYSLYLNDVEEGGETEFLYQSLRVSPTKGSLIIFPSFYTHIHRGNTPLKGTKYILTGWLEAVNTSPDE